MSVLSFAFSFLFFINSSFGPADFFKQWTGKETIDGWRILVLMICLFIVNFLYFVVLPTFWSGQTIFKKAFKIKFVSETKKKNFFLQILKREFLIWIPLMFFNIVAGIICVATNNPVAFFEALFDFSIQTTNQQVLEQKTVYYYLATFMKTLYALGGFVPAMLFIYMFAFRKKRALQDIVGGGYVVSTKPIVNLELKTQTKEWGLFKKTRRLAEEEQQKLQEEILNLEGRIYDENDSKYKSRKESAKNLKYHILRDDFSVEINIKKPTNKFTALMQKKETKKTESWYDER